MNKLESWEPWGELSSGLHSGAVPGYSAGFGERADGECSIDMAENTASEKAALKVPHPEGDRMHPAYAVMLGFVLAFLVLVCGVCGGAMWWFRPQIVENSEAARELTRDIIEITLPRNYQPKGTIVWNVAYTMRIRGAYYELFAGDGVLTILEVQSRFRAEEDIRRHIRQTLLEKGGGGAELVIDDQKTVQKLFTVRGQEVPFLFQIGEDRTRRDHRYHLVEGVFEGQNGEVLIALRIDADSWNETEVEQILRSLGAKQGPPG
jgi:hypothetical protein